MIGYPQGMYSFNPGNSFYEYNSNPQGPFTNAQFIACQNPQATGTSRHVGRGVPGLVHQPGRDDVPGHTGQLPADKLHADRRHALQDDRRLCERSMEDAREEAARVNADARCPHRAPRPVDGQAQQRPRNLLAHSLQAGVHGDDRIAGLMRADDRTIPASCGTECRARSRTR